MVLRSHLEAELVQWSALQLGSLEFLQSLAALLGVEVEADTLALYFQVQNFPILNFKFIITSLHATTIRHGPSTTTSLQT